MTSTTCSTAAATYSRMASALSGCARRLPGLMPRVVLRRRHGADRPGCLPIDGRLVSRKALLALCHLGQRLGILMLKLLGERGALLWSHWRHAVHDAGRACCIRCRGREDRGV